MPEEFVVLDSAVLGCRVVCCLVADAAVPSHLADLPVYAADELDALLAANPSPDDLRTVHAAKVALEGYVAPGGQPPALAAGTPWRSPLAASPPTAPAPLPPATCPACGGKLVAGRCGWC